MHEHVPNPTHKLVLLALANFADENDEAWPRVESLAEIASTSRRTVQRALAELEEAGLLTRVMGLTTGAHGGGLRKANTLYRLAVPDDVSRRSSDRVGRPSSLRVVSDAAAPVPDREASDETPSGIRCDMGVTTDVDESETPSGVRCDMGVTSEIQCDMGDAIQCDTGVAPYKEEPSSRNHQTPQTPHAGVGADAAMVGSGRVGDLLDESDRPGVGVDDVAPESDPGAEPSGEARVVEPASQELLDGPVGASAEDWRLVRSCLPDEMQALDAPSVARVAGLLRKRVEAGWSHRQLRDTLAGNALPPQVRSLSGLVAHRISQIPPDQAPANGKRSLRFEEPGEGMVPAWVRERRAAIDAGAPEAQRPLVWWAAQGRERVEESHEPTVGVGKGSTDR